MPRLHVVGASGYAAAEVIRFALQHPDLELGALESSSHAGEPVAAHAPLLRALDRRYDPPSAALERVASGDVVVTAGDVATARRLVPQLLERGARVVDLSDAYRLHAHSGGAVYGFTERYRDAIRHANVVANPGCYPTATLLALWPLAGAGLEITHLIVDAKSGITGAGRTPSVNSLFAEVDGDVRAYGLSGHRHVPEIVQELGAMGLGAPLTFTPHVVPLRRGMLVDAYALCANAPNSARVEACFQRAYAGSAFVRILPPDLAPSLVAVAGTNDAEIHVSCDGPVVRVLCAIDNLGKGAAGQAIANINVMLGFPEEAGLGARAVAV